MLSTNHCHAVYRDFGVGSAKLSARVEDDMETAEGLSLVGLLRLGHYLDRSGQDFPSRLRDGCRWHR